MRVNKKIIVFFMCFIMSATVIVGLINPILNIYAENKTTYNGTSEFRKMFSKNYIDEKVAENQVTIVLESDIEINDENWINEDNNTYTRTVTITSGQSKIDLPIISKDKSNFGGWKDSSGNKYVCYTLNNTNKTKKCQIDISNLGGQTITLKPIWYKYSIDITAAEYIFPTKVNAENERNTVLFSLINSMSEFRKKLTKQERGEHIVKFLNEYANELKVNYTIKYYEDEDTAKTVTRNNVILNIEWPEWPDNPDTAWGNGLTPNSNADYRGTYNHLDNPNWTPWIRLNDFYLKNLIAEAESKMSNNNISDITSENIYFSKWGYFNEDSNFYDGKFDNEESDANFTCIKIRLGNQNNDDILSNPNNISNNEKYMVETVSPSNVKLNLFDYWLFDRYYKDFQNNNYFEDYVGGSKTLVSNGVNAGRALLFKADNNGNHTDWNKWTRSSMVFQGIVKNELSETGYPQLNVEEKFNASGTWSNFGNIEYLVDEDLSYLFDTKTVNESNYGVAYENVKGLFQIDEDSGNYYYSSHDNFAEYDTIDNEFNVYNNWGVAAGGGSPAGQFFPFNAADEVFNVSGNKIVQNGINSKADKINHYLGLTMEAEFQQPADGMVSIGVNGKPMIFEFSGDDDVWIFIDDVLVADLGGVHDEAAVEIDFSTGAINIHDAKNPNNNKKSTTIKKQFETAGKSTTNFNGNTLPNNTKHTLKMFYLERGSTDSNLTLSFNLMEPVDNEIVKLDQYGDPVENAKFDMYVAETDENNNLVYDSETKEYKTVGDPIASSIITNSNGEAKLPGDYDYSVHNYYVLKEVAPTGYFSQGDIVLRYDHYKKHPDGTTSGTNLLLVDNRWTSGAVANFTATVTQTGVLKYDNPEFGEIDAETGKSGLILAIPLIKNTNGEWLPLYGSNMSGFNTIKFDSSDTVAYRNAILEAALYQIYGAEAQKNEPDINYGFSKWYLEWDDDNSRYQGVLQDLPGEASRYYWASGSADADLTMAYYFLNLNQIEGISGDTTDEKFTALYNVIKRGLGDNPTEEQIIARIKQLIEDYQTNNTDNQIPTFSLLDISKFNRVFSSRVYIANTQPQLSVLKLDQDGNPLEGVQFTLYDDEDCKKAIANGTTNKNGSIIFYHSATDADDGTIKVDFAGDKTYYLKETKTLENYEGFKGVIPVYITENGRIYADALEANDGVTVQKGLGKLLQTMVRYAGTGDINATLRDITSKLFIVDTFGKIDGVINANNSKEDDILNLHYGLSNALLEYGTHEINGVIPNPYFEVDEDIAGIIVNQNYSAHEGESLYSTVAVKTNLEDTNIRNLFTGSTRIVVRNRETNSLGKFSIKKTVSGSNASHDEQFEFLVKITKPENTTNETGIIDSNKSYSYEIKNDDEILETGTLTFSGNDTEGWKISSYTVSSSRQVTSSYFKQITEENESYFNIMLRDGESINVGELPFGLNVTVKELGATDYVTSVSVNNGSWQNLKEQSGIIEKPIGNPAFIFNNHRDKVTDLTITKKLPNESQSTKAFPFEVTLRDQAGASLLTGTYEWKIVSIANDNDQLVTDNNRETSGEITDGKLTVLLKHNEKVIIKDIPVDSTYIIKETTLGYAPTVEVNGKSYQVVNGAISGSVNLTDDTGSYIPVDVVYTNIRSGSITLTKRDGKGNILSGAGFTLYSSDGSVVVNETFTSLALKTIISNDDEKFDEDSMRYTDGTNSYTVHSGTDNKYFYYRFLTEKEKEDYYDNKFDNSENVEAIVQFNGLDLNKTYSIKETTIPEGYIQNSALEETLSNIKLPMEKNGTDYYDILYTVTNHAELVLPTTGINGIYDELLLATSLVALATIGWCYRKKIVNVFSKNRN